MAGLYYDVKHKAHMTVLWENVVIRWWIYGDRNRITVTSDDEEIELDYEKFAKLQNLDLATQFKTFCSSLELMRLLKDAIQPKIVIINSSS